MTKRSAEGTLSYEIIPDTILSHYVKKLIQREVKMIFKDEHDFSLFPKCFFMAAITTASLLAGYLMFVDENSLILWLKPYSINGNFTHQIILMFCLLFYVSRLFITVFVFLKRKMAWSEMLLVIPLIMALNFVFFIIPRLDKYLVNKYGEEFEEYAGRTKKLIPGIY